LCDAEVPVYMGAAKPLQRELEPATWFHGMDGLGDCGYAPTHRIAEPTDAIDAIIATALQHPGLELVTLGPLTNVAQAIQREPRIVSNISRCVVMGGAPCCEGNVTPAAEFNIWVDPEAARIVMLSGLPIELVGWQLSRYDAVLNEHDINQILAIGTPLTEFVIRCNGRAREAYFEQTGEHGISLPDPITMALLLEPTLALEASDHYVEIETLSPLTRGMTVVDKLDVTTDPSNATVWKTAHAQNKAEVIWKLDVPGWKRLLMTTLTVSK